MIKHQKLNSHIYQQVENKDIKTFDEYKSHLHDIVFRSTGVRQNQLSKMSKFDNESIDAYALRIKFKINPYENALKLEEMPKISLSSWFSSFSGKLQKI